MQVAQHFGVTADYLLGLTDIPVPLSAQEGNAEVQDAAAKLTAASAPARKAAIAAMEAVLAALDE